MGVRILEWAHGKFQNAFLSGHSELVCIYLSGHTEWVCIYLRELSLEWGSHGQAASGAMTVEEAC